MRRIEAKRRGGEDSRQPQRADAFTPSIDAHSRSSCICRRSSSAAGNGGFDKDENQKRRVSNTCYSVSDSKCRAPRTSSADRVWICMKNARVVSHLGQIAEKEKKIEKFEKPRADTIHKALDEGPGPISIWRWLQKNISLKCFKERNVLMS